MKITYIPNPNGRLDCYDIKNSVRVDFSSTENNNGVLVKRIEKDQFCLEFVIDYSSKLHKLYYNMIIYSIIDNYGNVEEFLKKHSSTKKLIEYINNVISNKIDKISFLQQLDKNSYEFVVKNDYCRDYRNNWILIIFFGVRVKYLKQYCCTYCGGFFDKLSQEHVIPKSKGKNTSTVILTRCCHECNNKRGNKELSEVLHDSHWFLKFLTTIYEGTDIPTLIKNARNPIKVDVFSDVFLTK